MQQPLLPGRATRAYDATTLRRDVLAGLTVAAVAVPQAMAYALIAGIPPQYGLYTAIVVTALGSILGSSDHLVNGPTNAISLVVFSAVAGLTLGPDNRLEAVFLLALSSAPSRSSSLFRLATSRATFPNRSSSVHGGAGFLVGWSKYTPAGPAKAGTGICTSCTGSG